MPPLSRISRPLPLESPLAFLYQTSTILRRSYASDAFGEIDTIELQQQARRKISADWSRVNRSPTRTRKSVKPAQSRSSNPRSQSLESRASPSRRTAPPPPPAPEREWIEHVPFEGVAERPATILDRLQGQTITRHEFNIFKDILAQGASAENAAKEAALKRKRRWDSTGRARGVVRQGIEMPELLKPLAEEAQNITAEKVKNEEVVEVLKEEKRTRRYREEIQKLMNEAATDAQLWQIWEGRLKADVEGALDTTTTKEDNPVNLSTLTTTLPQLLLHMSILLRETFPGSGYALSLLPSLRKMGPRAFTMGATTPLFNNHMRCLFETYTDLDSILACLTEMDRDVYEFDSETHQLLEDIFQKAERAGREGGVMGKLWGMERKVRALEKLEGWERVVAERIGRAEARRAEWMRGRGREEEGVGERRGLSVGD